MQPEPARCQDCGSAYEPTDAETRCPACRRKREKLLGLVAGAVKRGAAKRGASSGDIARQLNNIANFSANTGNSGETCLQCNERPAQNGSPFCLACRLALFKSLGDAAAQTKQNQHRKKKHPESRMESMSTSSALSEKRRRTGSHRFNPAPSQRKGYR